MKPFAKYRAKYIVPGALDNYYSILCVFMYRIVCTSTCANYGCADDGRRRHIATLWHQLRNNLGLVQRIQVCSRFGTSLFKSAKQGQDFRHPGNEIATRKEDLVCVEGPA